MSATPGRPQNVAAPRAVWLGRAKRLLGLLVVGLALYYLGRRLALSTREPDWRALDVAPGYLALALLLTTGCVLAGGWVWRLVLAALGHPLPLGTCLRIHTLSNLAKYLPGYAWQLLGKVYLTRNEGVPGPVATLGIALELGGLLTTAGVVALGLAPDGWALPGVGGVPWGMRAVLALALLGTLAAAPWLLRVGARWPLARRLIPAGLAPRAAPWWGACGVMLLAWLCFGLGFGAILRALQPLTGALWGRAIYALAAGFIVSLLALFVPGGIGVRESVMVWALGTTLPGGIAVAAAVASRFLLILAEVLAVALAWGRQGITLFYNRSITRKD